MRPRHPESQCVAEERRIRDCLEEAVTETDVGQDEHVARVVVVVPSRVVPQVKVAAWLDSRARLAETRSGPALPEKLLHVLCRATRGPIVHGKAGMQAKGMQPRGCHPSSRRGRSTWPLLL